MHIVDLPLIDHNLFVIKSLTITLRSQIASEIHVCNKNTGKYRWFWTGIKDGIPLCCISFFEYSWIGIKSKIPQYGQTMTEITNNQGVILCPDCLVKKIILYEKITFNPKISHTTRTTL